MAGCCAYEVRLKVYRILAAILCTIIVVLQGLVLNYYLATYKSKVWWAWVVADVVNLIVFIGAFVVSFVYLEKRANGEVNDSAKSGNELPLGYIAWLCYSCLLVPRVGIIFEDIAGYLKEEYVFGPNTLKITVAMSCIVFLLLVTTHHDAAHASERHSFIVSISHSVTFNIFDTVAILELLFVSESRILLTFTLHRVINAFACLNLILPVVPLLVLSRTRYGKLSMTKLLRTVHTLLNLLVINLPLFVIRMYLWHALSKNISVFLMKNLLGIAFTVKDLYDEWLGPHASQKSLQPAATHPKTEMIELQPATAPVAEASDILDESTEKRYKFV